MRVDVPRSPHLVFRPLSPGDAQAFHQLVVDAHVRRYLFDDEALSFAWCASAIEQAQAEHKRTGLGLWLLFERSSSEGAPIGFAGFWRFATFGSELQLLYALKAAHTGRGLATEAAAALVDFGRARAGLGYLSAVVDEPNRASVRVLEKLGFEVTRTLSGAAGLSFLLTLPSGRPPQQLRTERLLLRPWRDDDLSAFAALNADARVMRYFTSTLSPQESDTYAARIRGLFQTQGYGLWAVEVPGVAPFIGFTGLAIPTFDSHFTPCVEIGWRLAAEYWGRGYAPEAARAALRAAFVHLGLNQVVSFTAVGNQPSRRVMEKLGMRHVPSDDFDHPRLAAGHPLRRHVLYRLDRASWVASEATRIAGHAAWLP